MKKGIGLIAAAIGMAAAMDPVNRSFYGLDDNIREPYQPRAIKKPVGDLHVVPKGCVEEKIQIQGIPIRIVYQNARGRDKKIRHWSAEVDYWIRFNKLNRRHEKE